MYFVNKSRPSPSPLVDLTPSMPPIVVPTPRSTDDALAEALISELANLKVDHGGNIKVVVPSHSHARVPGLPLRLSGSASPSSSVHPHTHRTRRSPPGIGTAAVSTTLNGASRILWSILVVHAQHFLAPYHLALYPHARIAIRLDALYSPDLRTWIDSPANVHGSPNKKIAVPSIPSA